MKLSILRFRLPEQVEQPWRDRQHHGCSLLFPPGDVVQDAALIRRLHKDTVRSRRAARKRLGRCLPIKFRYVTHPRVVLVRYTIEFELKERRHVAMYDTVVRKRR